MIVYFVIAGACISGTAEQWRSSMGCWGKGLATMDRSVAEDMSKPGDLILEAEVVNQYKCGGDWVRIEEVK